MSSLGAEARHLANRFRVVEGKNFRMKEFDPADIRGTGVGKEKAEEMLQQGVALLSEMQEKLYAQDRWALLLIFQAMDAAGKDSTIKHVMSGVNPQGCEVFSFKAPSAEELNHDFLWRTSKSLPERGRIGIFNRSYYEEVLIVRVHRELLMKEQLPPHLVTKKIWKERYADINAFERYAARNGIIIRKFFLHVSREEQKKRFLARLDNPHKNWKFSMADVQERDYRDDYMKAYEAMIRHTATTHAPWYVVPADVKWFTHLVVASAIVDTLDGLNLTFPEVDEERRNKLAAARAVLEGKEPAAAVPD